jgi:hypothetical protein
MCLIRSLAMAFPLTGAKEIESIHCDRNHCTPARDGSEMRYHSHSEIRYGRISKLQQGLNDSVHSHDTVDRRRPGRPDGAQQLAAAGRQVHVFDAMPRWGANFWPEGWASTLPIPSLPTCS